MCGRQVGLIFLTICAAELTTLLIAGKLILRVLFVVEDFEMLFQSTWLGKDLTALRTFVISQVSFTGSPRFQHLHCHWKKEHSSRL